MRTSRLPARQQGVVLFIALIVLVAMSLAGVALVRSVDTSLGIAGNMAFKQATLQGSDLGIKEAYTWLAANNTGTILQGTAAGQGYYSSSPGSVVEDWFELSKWNGSKLANGGLPDGAGNTVRYIIHRMCTFPDTAYNGSVAGVPNECALSVTGGGTAGGSMSVGATQFEGVPALYYRITSRVDGPRNTVSIVQVSVIFKV
jgi:Tfp pilus assembly protein PilX